MEVKKFIEMLESEGLEVTETTGNKWGEPIKAYMIGEHDSNIRPTVYEEQINAWTEDQAKEVIISRIKNTPDFKQEEIMNKEYILQNVTLAIRGITEDDSILKLTVRGDLEIYFRVSLKFNDENASFKVTQNMIKNVGIEKSELYEAAFRNTEKEAEIISMFEMIKSMGFPVPEVEEEVPLYVATNKERINGAAVMECKDVIDKFCYDHGYKGVAIIPSSIHEVLLVPITTDMSEEYMNNMIREVNETQVAEHDRLSDHVYYNYI